MLYPINQWIRETPISFTEDVSGVVAIATDEDESVYFAQVAKGDNPTIGLAPDNLYNLILGKYAADGTLQWMINSPELRTTTDNSEVSIVVGPDKEVYVAFVTLGAVPGRYNCADVLSFCPENCTNPGRHDIVLARINSVNNTPTIAWRVQSANLNSCNEETKPQLAIDRIKKLLYIVYECNYNILCYPKINNGPNVVISCFGLGGAQYWYEGGIQVNSTGENRNPVVAADTNGGAYIAFEATTGITGGAPHATTQAEVIKFQTNVSSTGTFQNYSRAWVLSGLYNYFPTDGVGFNPAITATRSGQICLAFRTNGSIPGGTNSTGGNFDTALIAFRSDGTVLWYKQGPDLNLDSYLYTSVFKVSLSSDYLGYFYLAMNVLWGTVERLLVFKLNSNYFETLWGYTAPNGTFFNCYTVALPAGKNTILPEGNANDYSLMNVSVFANVIYIALATPYPAFGESKYGIINDGCIASYRQAIYAENMTAFEYITVNKNACDCESNDCGCS